jgi:hypothetical protein
MMSDRFEEIQIIDFKKLKQQKKEPQSSPCLGSPPSQPQRSEIPKQSRLSNE